MSPTLYLSRITIWPPNDSTSNNGADNSTVQVNMEYEDLKLGRTNLATAGILIFAIFTASLFAVRLVPHTLSQKVKIVE